MTVLAGSLLPLLQFDGRIDIMLPDRSELRSLFGFFRDIEVADKILVTLSTRNGAPAPGELAAAADRYVANLDPALATPLNLRSPAAGITDDYDRLVRHLPEYLTAEDFDRLRGGVATADDLRRALQALLNRLQKPEGLLAMVPAGADPLGWSGILGNKLLQAATSSGYRAVPVGHHLMDPDQAHLLLVLQTPVLMTDTVGGRRLLAHLAERAAGLPDALEARLVCGHLHTAGNETVIRRDIRNTGIAITIVFLALFLGVYRDGRAIGILMIPFLASLPALALAAAIFNSFSYIVLGFGSVIAGIAVDYGIHTYVAARSDHPGRNLQAIRKPVVLSALTTLCVFVAFCFSSIPAYRQLGAFASMAVLISLGYAFWALPPFVRRPAAAPRPDSVRAAAALVRFSGISRARAGAVAGALAVLLLLGFGLLFRLRFEADIAKLDGTPAATLATEARAVEVWGGGHAQAAILAVSAPNEAAALRLNDRLYEGLRAAGLAADRISSLAPLGPAPETRQERRAAWNAYWTAARSSEFRHELEAEAAALGFTTGAFQEFWARFEAWRQEMPAEERPAIGFLEPLRRQFIHEQNGQVLLTTFIPDEARWTGAARDLQESVPGLRVISRRAFSADLSQTVIREMGRISLLAAVLILGVTGLAIRRVGLFCYSLIPAVAGMIWGGAGMALWGLPLNVTNLIAGILVFGLTIDYGICMAYASQRGLSRDMFRAVTLSALTTVLGAAVLLIARHPAFKSIGITLVFGVTAGYLYAWLALPAVQALVARGQPPEDPAGRAGAS